ncbi:hypothetical protein DQ244_12215 [Blastococcus sp. TBT05-19]|nr:hypothetical protein DQ244_12215 [Blastococcus sp. TBT05-19]
MAAGVTAAATTLHYALPDLIADRRRRGWAKAGVLAVAVAAAVPELRAGWDGARGSEQPDGEASVTEVFRSLPPARKAVALAPVALVLGASAGWLALVERWIFRRGQARAAAGKRWPHTGPALVYGALAGAFWFIEPPADQD